RARSSQGFVQYRGALRFTPSPRHPLTPSDSVSILSCAKTPIWGMLAAAPSTVEGFCVTNIRALRLSRGLSLIELAILSDIPARTLAEIEYGLQRLDYESRLRLARIFDLPPEQLWAGSVPPRVARKAAWH